MLPVVLTVAGSDPSGGAGLQADLKTFHQFGVYGAAAVTLITVQNTQSVFRVEVLPPDLVRDQILAVTEDLPVSFLKIGALGSAANVLALADLIDKLKIPAVLDPVMISKHGSPLLPLEACSALRDDLLPRVFLVTPNLPEAEALTGETNIEQAATQLRQTGCPNVLIKGGHGAGNPADFLLTGSAAKWIEYQRIHTVHTHGTGCTLAAGIAASLASGFPLLAAVERAGAFVHQAIATAPGLGRGHGPLNHFIKPSD